jgi:hypothetical protein
MALTVNCLQELGGVSVLLKLYNFAVAKSKKVRKLGAHLLAVNFVRPAVIAFGR